MSDGSVGKTGRRVGGHSVKGVCGWKNGFVGCCYEQIGYKGDKIWQKHGKLSCCYTNVVVLEFVFKMRNYMFVLYYH